jgi:hypothetical protein
MPYQAKISNRNMKGKGKVPLANLPPLASFGSSTPLLNIGQTQIYHLLPETFMTGTLFSEHLKFRACHESYIAHRQSGSGN